MSQVINPTTPQFAGTIPGFPGPVIQGKDGFNNRLNGTFLNDYVTTGSGDDVVGPAEGDDTVITGAGDDSAAGGSGNDQLYTGTGNDTASGGDGNDTVSGQEGNDSLSGGAGNDQVLGGVGSDTGSGGSGNDDINGEQGSDIMSGDEGNDTVRGGKGNDTIDGGEGNDYMLGDRGSDMVTGGSGSDTFVLITDPDNGIDTLVDYSPSTDKIALTTNVPNKFYQTSGPEIPGIGSSLDSSEFFTSKVGLGNVGDFAKLNPGAKVIYDQPSGLLYIHKGNGVVQALAQLPNGLTISNTNFEIL